MLANRTTTWLKSSTALSAAILGGALLLRPVPVDAQPSQPTVQQLQAEIHKRDALIEDLISRVNKLEREVNQVAAKAGYAGRASAHQPTQPTRQVARASPPAPAAAPPAPPPPPPGQAADQQASSHPAPGQFKVDVQAAQRALERTLTASGALLVPYGSIDLEPTFSYTRRETPSQVVYNVNRNEFAASLNVRIGLPWESQLSLGLPVVAAQQQIVDNINNIALSQLPNGFGAGLGDLTIGLSKTLMHQAAGWRPDLIASISYEAPTGQRSASGIALPGSGQSRLNFSLTALKRQDPLAFVASVGYSKAFEYDHLNPGDQLTFTGGVYLASSPQTTLSALLQQSFVQAPTFNGVTGSNSVQSVLVLGASSILGRGVLLDLQVGVGLTKDAPKYSVLVSFPIRFTL